MSIQRGFSLIEMLVVLFVIVLMTGLVTLNVNSGAGDDRLRDRLEALSSVAAYALDEAQFSGADFGVLLVEGVDEQGLSVVTVHWRQRLPQGWRVPETSADVFAPVVFPANAEVLLYLDNTEVLPAPPDAADPLAGVTPQWLLLASGETQVGELVLRDMKSGNTLWRLSWDALARFEQYRGDDNEVFGAYAASP